MTSDAKAQADYRARLKAGQVGPVGQPPATDDACGTEAGAARHRRRGESVCDRCRTAESAARRARRG